MRSMANVPFSIRMDETTRERLKREAKQINRSETYFANMAIEKELRARELKRSAIDTAFVQAEQGSFISSEAMGAWVDSWGSDNELSLPEVDIKNTK